MNIIQTTHDYEQKSNPILAERKTHSDHHKSINHPQKFTTAVVKFRRRAEK